MILRLVDRRTDPDTDRYDWSEGGAGAELLAGLVGQLGQPDWEIDVVLVSDEAMARLNEDFRKAPGVTDVLSFSYLQGTGPGPADLVGGQGHALSNLWLDTLAESRENGIALSVGEVVLAPGFISERCRDNGWSLEHEIPLLLVHGILHILGWDHASEDETEAMRSVEEKILAVEGLPHPLRERS
ncbi:MAG: rRNA maturation RNase YbeY [Candidatus Krumholzibacteria bacterium]|nr:rRNA maturation RNase YbeY [Candidatus Krumholzibacteria bacterium]